MRRLRFVGWALIIVFFMIAATDRARTQGKFGVSVIFGEPTGLAWKYRISGSNAVDGAVGLAPGDRFRINLDYLWEKHSFQVEHLLLHYGAGAAFGAGGSQHNPLDRGESRVLAPRDFGVAVRGVAGLTYEFPRSPFDAFVEIAPLFILSPESEMGIDAALGVRIYP